MFPRLVLICALILNSAAISFPAPAPAIGNPPAGTQSAHHVERGTPLWPQDGASFYSFHTSDGVTVNVVVADMKSGKWQLKPVFNHSLAGTSVAARKSHASAAINGGYFDPSTGESVSFIVLDGHKVENARPHKGEKPHRDDLSSYRGAIANRSELRILADKDGKQSIEIVPHDSPVPAGLKLLHSLQGGPQLLPVLTTRGEAFIRKDRRGKVIDVISSSDRAARTAFGITSDGRILLVAVEGPEQGGNSPGLSLSGLSHLMQELGCTQALNLDGGHSTTMVVRLGQAGNAAVKTPTDRVVCGTNPQRRVKTVLVLVPAAGR